jgi:PTS system fructose-specific IIC component
MTGLSQFDLHRASPLLTLAVVIIAGVVLGTAARKARLPAITGQVVAGIAIGRAGFDLFGPEALHGLGWVTDFALGLIAVTVGAHLNFKRLRNAGRRLVFQLVTETTLVPAAVFLATWGLTGRSPEEALLYATVAIATAPATIVALVKETRARGVFVKTLLGTVALNNLTCIVLFEVARAILAAHLGGPEPVAHELAIPGLNLVGSACIGASLAVGMNLAARIGFGRRRLSTAALVALLLAIGLAHLFNTSPLLTCLFLGLVQSNLTPEKAKLVDALFSDFEPVILVLFFTLAGMHLTFDRAGLMGALAAAFFVARIVGKLVASYLAMSLAGATRTVRNNLGLALVPQAGVAVGLMLLVQEQEVFQSIAGVFAGVVLLTVTANELLGPVLTRLALFRSGEVQMDRSRLLDFLQEENILLDLAAPTKEEAITKLVDLLIRSHHLVNVDRQALLTSVLAREAELSTCFGNGLAIPHGEIEGTDQMYGVMGLSREGLPFDTPDGEPVRCMVLLATPPDQRQRHLEVLAALAQTVARHQDILPRLTSATSAAHAYEILHAEDAIAFNYFLDDGTGGSMPPRKA